MLGALKLVAAESKAPNRKRVVTKMVFGGSICVSL